MTQGLGFSREVPRGLLLQLQPPLVVPNMPAPNQHSWEPGANSFPSMVHKLTRSLEPTGGAGEDFKPEYPPLGISEFEQILFFIFPL